MNWQGVERRLPLPLLGCVLVAGATHAMLSPAKGETALAGGYRAIWAAQSPQAAPPLLEALRLDPGSPDRWLDLSEAMFETGRDNDARYCLERALARAPGLPHVAMRAAGMYFRLGDRITGLRMTHRAVNETSDYDSNVFQIWKRLGGSAEDVFASGVGSNAAAGRGYFRFLIDDAAEPAVADAAWTILQGKGMVSVDESRFYAESLTGAHEYDRAASLEAGILPDGLWNGGFEGDWTGHGLDWRVDSIPGITVTRDTNMRYHGEGSLRIEFDGSNRNAFQFVSQTRVLPGGTWKLRAMLKTELKLTAHLSGSPEAGIGLRIVDADTSRVLAETILVNFSQDWTPIETRFDAGPSPRAVRIEMVRPTQPAIELTMAGTAWLDDVTLTAEAAR